MIKSSIIAMIALMGVGCASMPLTENEPLEKGPMAVSSIITPYDVALSCLSGAYQGKYASIGVGAISDETGKFAIGEGGNGKFVTQGAGDIVTSALRQTKVVHVLNRRDPRVMQMEQNQGRKLKWVPSDFHITGSINSLDFLPGGGAEVMVSGVGLKYRQHRLLVGMDLFLTNTMTSEVVGVSSIFKQIVAEDMGGGIGRFFGNTLVAVDFGQKNREPVHFAMRSMLKLATYELVANLYDVQNNGCSKGLEDPIGVYKVPTEVSVDAFDSNSDVY